MGLLDDAIREHLELKRRRGADAGEVARQEQEALGPAAQARRAGGSACRDGGPSARGPGRGRLVPLPAEAELERAAVAQEEPDELEEEGLEEDLPEDERLARARARRGRARRRA